MTAALEVSGLSVGFNRGRAILPVLRDVSFAIAPGEAYGLVGESGCGKTTVAFACLRALAPGGAVTGGKVLFQGQDIATLSARDLRLMRSRSIGMVYQDPARALNPSMTIGRQIGEVFNLLGLRGRDATMGALDILARTRIADPGRVMRAYPHELSGGMQQRVVIAMALAKKPALLVLDEPTTGLDATVAVAVLDLICALRRAFSTALLFISHDLRLVGKVCDRIGVLYAGSLMEEGPTGKVLERPRHPYSAALLGARAVGVARRDGALPTIAGALPNLADLTAGCVFAPRCAFAVEACGIGPPPRDVFDGQTTFCRRSGCAEVTHGRPVAQTGSDDTLSNKPHPVVQIRNVSKSFGAGARRVRVVWPVSLDLLEGETIGLVGESGSGKTTLARVLLGLTAPDEGGQVLIAGAPANSDTQRRSLAQHKALQIIFQNPDSALNRAQSVRQILARPLIRLAGLSRSVLESRLAKIVESVRLMPEQLALRPRALSGGMKQRVAIARAFAAAPRVVVCDEPTSALDLSIQAAILNLLADLRERDRMSYLLISHDLTVIRYLADRIAVMYRGRMVQIGAADAVLAGPHHPYTETLLAAAGIGALAITGGAVAERPDDKPAGCVFQARCHRKIGEVCETVAPPMSDLGVFCHLPLEQSALLEIASPPDGK